MTTKEPQGEHSVLMTTKTSRAEQLMYGPYAPLVRRLADVAVAADSAKDAIAEALRSAREADGFTSGDRDDTGRSGETAWLEDVVYRQAWDNYSACAETYVTIATECVKRWEAHRQTGGSDVKDADPA